jgi:hypothetical protein
MNDILNPPAGSRLSVIWTDGSPTILAAPPRRGGGMAFAAAFLLFWLAGWSYGGFAVAGQAMSGAWSWFEATWLGGWALGEAFALYALYRIVRPPIPERFVARADRLDYDSGLGPPQPYAGYNRDSWSWPKRTRRAFTRADLDTLRLRETSDCNRLTVDAGAERYDLAKAGTDVEREWLYRALAQYYRLPRASEPGA